MKKYISPLLLLIASIIWGLGFSAQKFAAEVPAFTIGVSRNIMATVFLLAILPMLDKIRGNDRKDTNRKGIYKFTKYELVGGSIAGGVLCAASALQQFGIGDGTDAGKASFITALYVVLVPVFGIFFNRKASLNVWISVAIAVLGFYLLCIDGSYGIAASDLLVLLCALVFAAHILVVDRFSPNSDGVRFACIQFATGAVLNLILALIFESPIDLELLITNILPIMFLGFGSSGVAYTLQIVGQKGTNPTVASLIMSLESVFGVIGSVILLDEVMKTKEYIGCIIVFLAVILAQIEFKPIVARLRRGRTENTNE